MQKLRATSIILAMMSAVFAAEQAKSDDVIMTDKEIKEALIGNTLNGYVYRSGLSLQAYYAPDGKAYAQGSNFSDEGKWEMPGGNKMCFTWRQIRGGAKQCFRFRRFGEEFESLTESGSRSTKFSISKKGEKNF